MLAFIARRLLASVLVLLAATFVMYILVSYSGDPLEDLYASAAPNKLELIEARIKLLHLDVPPVFRYFIWLGGLFTGNLGVSIQGLSTNALLSNAVWSTIQLVTTAQILAIIIGLIVGIITALRQYSAFDYVVTFIAFLFFSLPVFWVAILLKQYLAIEFNNWLADPVVALPWLIGLSLLAGIVWSSLLGGGPRRRWLVFGIGVAATAGVLIYTQLTDWFTNPSIGIVGVAITGAGFAFLVTAISVGLRKRRVLWASLIAAGVGVALYYPMTLFVFRLMNIWLLIGLAIVAIGVGFAIGWFSGDPDRRAAGRTVGIVAFLTAGVLALDGYFRWWYDYVHAARIHGRPIATIGSETPQLGGNFWIQGIDTFTHLLLPTIAIMLISVASLSRYARASMLEVLGQDYIRTARAKGLTERTVVVRHALRNALIPVTTIIALDLGALIGGAVITEKVFGWKGMGSLFSEALSHSDPNPVMAFFIITGTLAVVFNLIADLLYAGLDPRIRVTA